MKIIAAVLKYQIPILVFVNSIWIGLMFLVNSDIFDESSSWQNISAIVLVFAILCTLFCAFKMNFYQKLIAKVLLWIGVLWFAVIIVVFYLISDGFKDYKEYCAHFIPLIDSYYLINRKYPDSLDEIDDKLIKYIRYKPKRCGYMHSNDGYSFYFGEGFSVYGYDSKTKMWWQD